MYHVHKELGVNESVMWGEYYFVEALDSALRQMQNKGGRSDQRTVRLFRFSGLVAAGCAGVSWEVSSREYRIASSRSLLPKPRVRRAGSAGGLRQYRSLRPVSFPQSPSHVRMSGLRPCVMRYSRTEFARCSESRWLYASLPTLSVWPSTSISKPGCESTIPATRASFSRATGRSVYFAVSNRTSDMFTMRPLAVSRVSRIMLN